VSNEIRKANEIEKANELVTATCQVTAICSLLSVFSVVLFSFSSAIFLEKHLCFSYSLNIILSAAIRFDTL